MMINQRIKEKPKRASATSGAIASIGIRFKFLGNISIAGSHKYKLFLV